MMGPREPPISPKVAFPMPTRMAGDHDFTKYIVENHHLSMYKSVLNASAQIDNTPPKSWVTRKEWEKSGGRKSAGDAVWNLNGRYMEKLLADRRMALSLDDSALAWLGDKGYDPVYGARPLKRVIQKELIDPIARKLLAGDIEDGSVISVRAGEDGLAIGKAQVH